MGSKYNYNTSYRMLVNAAKQKTEICAGAKAWSKRFLGKTIEEMRDASCLQDKDYNPSWGVWLLISFGTGIDIIIRKRLIIAIKDPMMALRLYLDLDWLTDEEDRLLEGIFKGKLPTPEKKLTDGTLTRAKWQ